MAQIFKANDRQTGEAVAIKVPLMRWKAMSRVSSASNARRRSHPPQPPGRVEGDQGRGKKSRPYLVMEFLDGETLAKILEKTKPLPSRGGALCEPDLRRPQLSPCQWHHASRSEAAKHHGLPRWQPTLVRLRHRARRPGARLTFVGFTPAWARPITWRPNRSRAGAAITVPTSTASARSSTRWRRLHLVSRREPVHRDERPAHRDPVAPRKVNERLTPVIERSFSTPWSAIRRNGTPAPAR